MPIVDYNFPFYDKIEEHDIQNLFNNLNENYQNLILVPVNGDKSLYRYDENDSTVTIQFILNDPMNLFTHIIITDNEEFTETYKISDITISPNILSVELNVPCSFVLYAKPCIYDNQLEDVVELDVQPCKFYVFNINSLDFQSRGIPTPFWDYSFGGHYNPLDYEDYFSVVYFQKFGESENPVRFYSISDNGYECIFENGGYPCPGDHIVMKHSASQEIAEFIQPQVEDNYITFSSSYPFRLSLKANSLTIKSHFYYSVDKTSWNPLFQQNDALAEYQEASNNYEIYVVGMNLGFDYENSSSNIIPHFEYVLEEDNINDATLYVSGNIYSLLDYTVNPNQLQGVANGGSSLTRLFSGWNSSSTDRMFSVLDCSELDIPFSVTCKALFLNNPILSSTPTIDYSTYDSEQDYLTYKQFSQMFQGCTSLTECPELPCTQLSYGCYERMFYGCTSLNNLPALPATSLPDYCYSAMFYGCSSIQLSESSTAEYSNQYKIPTSDSSSISVGTSALSSMFGDTGGTFTGTPLPDVIYYTSNTIVPAEEVEVLA